MVIILPMVLKDRAASSPQEKIAITMPSDPVPSVATPSDFDSNVVPNEPINPDVGVSTEPVPTEPVERPAETPTLPVEEKSASTHKFYVQIGVFSDAANVKQLQAKLDGLGYKSRTEKIKTDKGEKIRLKTQVFADRNEAAIALEKIKDAGLTGMVVSQQ
jgi:DedD protein